MKMNRKKNMNIQIMRKMTKIFEKIHEKMKMTKNARQNQKKKKKHEHSNHEKIDDNNTNTILEKKNTKSIMEENEETHNHEHKPRHPYWSHQHTHTHTHRQWHSENMISRTSRKRNMRSTFKRFTESCNSQCAMLITLRCRLHRCSNQDIHLETINTHTPKHTHTQTMTLRKQDFKNNPKEQYGFKFLVVHWIMQLTMLVTLRCCLHRTPQTPPILLAQHQTQPPITRPSMQHRTT